MPASESGKGTGMLKRAISQYQVNKIEHKIIRSAKLETDHWSEQCCKSKLLNHRDVGCAFAVGEQGFTSEKFSYG